MRRWVAGISLLVGAVAYATFLLEGRLSPDLDRMHGYVSELSAVDQPFHGVYGAGDAVTGVLAVLVAVIMLTERPRRPLTTAGWTALGLFGVCAIGDAAFPLDCAPSLATSCALAERTGHVTFAHTFHAVTSSAVIFFGVAALLLLGLAARRYGRWRPLAVAGVPLAVLEALAGATTVATMLAGDWLGAAQRAQILILVVGLLVIAVSLLAERPAGGVAESADEREEEVPR